MDTTHHIIIITDATEHIAYLDCWCKQGIVLVRDQKQLSGTITCRRLGGSSDNAKNAHIC